MKQALTNHCVLLITAGEEEEEEEGREGCRPIGSTLALNKKKGISFLVRG